MNTTEQLAKELLSKLNEAEKALEDLAEHVKDETFEKLKEKGFDAEPDTADKIQYEADSVSRQVFGKLGWMFGSIRDAAAQAAGISSGFSRPFQNASEIDAELGRLAGLRAAVSLAKQ